MLTLRNIKQTIHSKTYSTMEANCIANYLIKLKKSVKNFSKNLKLLLLVLIARHNFWTVIFNVE